MLTGHPPGPFEAHIPLHASPHRLAGTCCLSAPHTHPCPCISEALALPGSHRARDGHSPAPPSLPCFVILGSRPLAILGQRVIGNKRGRVPSCRLSVRQAHSEGWEERGRQLREAGPAFQTCRLFHTHAALSVPHAGDMDVASSSTDGSIHPTQSAYQAWWATYYKQQ